MLLEKLSDLQTKRRRKPVPERLPAQPTEAVILTDPVQSLARSEAHVFLIKSWLASEHSQN